MPPHALIVPIERGDKKIYKEFLDSRSYVQMFFIQSLRLLRTGMHQHTCMYADELPTRCTRSTCRSMYRHV